MVRTCHSGPVRTFAALVPPDEVAEDVAEFLAPRREAAAFRWTSPEQIHLTLAFYDDVPEHRLDALLEALATAAARRGPLDLRIAGGDAFPDPDRGRVLVAGIEADERSRAELDRLAEGCRNAASRAGVRVDGQRFRPHLTVARCGRPTSLTSWVRLLDGYRGPAWAADEVRVIASHLGEGPRRRPRHEVLATLPLTGGPDGSRVTQRK